MAEGGVKNDPTVSDLVKILEYLSHILKPFSENCPHSQGRVLILESHCFGSLALLPFLGMDPSLLWELPTPHHPSMVTVEATVLTHKPCLRAPDLKWNYQNSSSAWH